ncbi:toxin-antitoxin system YwqK family antitoxin [Pedobacter sp. WC2423]|uniref:toxin-antitoxin system YwqK family antitoxin n=1 Tax=Pedobacter sp. WC2423 TaxID=3234142 RepID=UPI0034663A1F
MKVKISDIEFNNPINDGTFGIHLYEGDKLTGFVFENWTDTDILKTEYEVKNGLQDGLEKCYYQDGKLESQIEYKKGREHGEARYYDENGELIEKIIFEYGIGISYEIYENGILSNREDIEEDSAEYRNLLRFRELKG